MTFGGQFGGSILAPLNQNSTVVVEHKRVDLDRRHDLSDSRIYGTLGDENVNRASALVCR